MSALAQTYYQNCQNPISTYIVSRGYGEEANFIKDNSKYFDYHFRLPITMQTINQRFNNLSATWKEDTKMLSSIGEIIAMPSYLEIISMGKPVVPLILNELKNEPDHWFIALNSITGANPIKKEERGNMKLMTNSWLKWGKENGYNI